MSEVAPELGQSLSHVKFVSDVISADSFRVPVAHLVVAHDGLGPVEITRVFITVDMCAIGVEVPRKVRHSLVLGGSALGSVIEREKFGSAVLAALDPHWECRSS